MKLKAIYPKNSNTFRIAPLIILPFIENAFKHGVSNFPGVAFVQIEIQVAGNKLLFNIENTKNKIKAQEQGHSKGIGLVNVKKRLDLMYPEKYILSIKDLPETFSVNLTIELDE